MLSKTLLLFCAFRSVACQICPSPPYDSVCIAIKSWEDFVTEVNEKSNTDEIVFCPFLIKKSTGNPLVLKRKIALICQEEGNCIMDHMPIDTGGSFFKIRGRKAQVTLSGFVFQNAGDRNIGSKSSAIVFGAY